MTDPAAAAGRLAASRWSLLAGNFAIGCGVMVVPGSLVDLTRSLGVSVALGGQLITIAAVTMGIAAPVLAAVVGGWDRRRLLTFALAWFAIGHALAALTTSYAVLTPLRALGVLGAAVFTPQAAAAIGRLAPPEARGSAITFVFLGWSLASVLGLPLHSWIGEAFGWRWAFGLVALLAAAAALGVWRTLPDGLRPPSPDLRGWGELFTHPALMAVVLVTALSAAGQFSVFSYFAPYYRQVIGADAAETSLLFAWFGAFGLVGNVLLSRQIDRVGTARAVTVLLALMGVSLLAWPLAATPWALAVVLVPWGLGCFASNSAQQARLGLAAPRLAPALLALNTSAIYVGQAIGAAGGGVIVAAGGGAPEAYRPLSWVGLGWLAVAVALSVWATRRMQRAGHG